MNEEWNQFLLRQGALPALRQTPGAPGFGLVSDRSELSAGFLVPLSDLGLIAVSGDDAANFLHNQLTNDVEHLGPDQCRLAGYCSPKGRLLATFTMWRTGDTFFLQLPHELQATVQKRLQMFVMRAKAKLFDAGGEYVALGLGGAAAPAALQAWFPELPDAPYAKVDHAMGSLLRVADAFGQARYQWIAAVEQAKAVWPGLSAALKPADLGIWHLSCIHAGVPQVTSATQEKFVPQMVNYELVGGVNFKKGCYPGQEIVARSQYLGKLKRRMLLASVDAEATEGMDVFSEADLEQPCGMIVNVAPGLQGGVDCLVELKTAALEAGQVRLGSSSGGADVGGNDSSVVLRFAPLPYALPSDNEER